MRLELAAARWLKYEKNCALVIMERSPRARHSTEMDEFHSYNHADFSNFQI